MKKLLLTSWLMMLSIVAMAQAIIVKNNDGSVNPYDVNKVTSVEFQASPAGFTVNQEGKSDKYEFANVKGIATSPNGISYHLECTNSPQYITLEGKAYPEFKFTRTVQGYSHVMPFSGATLNFSGNGIKFIKSSDKTSYGVVEAFATVEDIYTFTEGVVTATYADQGVNVSAQCAVKGLEWQSYTLACTNSPQFIDAEGNGSLTFQLTGIGAEKGGTSKTYDIPNATVHFTCTEGTCDQTATTDNLGKVTVNFHTDDPENFKKSTITASFERFGKKAEAEGIVYGLPTYTLTCTNSPQEIDADGDAFLTFNLTATTGEETAPVQGATLNFSATNGKWDYTAHGSQTQEDGNIELKFSVEETDLLEFTEGSLTATFEKDGKTYTATGQVTGNLEWTLELNPFLSEKQICSDGTTDGAFTLIATVTDKEGGESQFPIPGITVNCTTTSGTCTPSAVAGEEEEFAFFVFQTDDILNFEGATVTGTCEYKGKTYEGTFKVLPLDWDYTLICKNSGQTIDEEGKATLQFQLEATTTANLAGTATTDIIEMFVPKATVNFASSEGSCSPTSGVTNEAGMVEVVFQASDPKTFEEGKVTATYVKGAKITTGEGEVKGNPEQGGTPCDTGDDDLNKADQLDNAYVVKNKKTGETVTRTFAPKWSEYSANKESVSIQLEDADENGGTQGMVYGMVPLTMVDVVAALTGAQFENTPGAKIGFELYAGENPIMGSFAKFSGKEPFGGIKPDGKSKILLRKPCTTKTSLAKGALGNDEEAYSGDYEFLFYFVFTNEFSENGEEYEVYGKGTMKMHVPTITSFQVQAEKDWVKVGESTKVNLQGYYEEEAAWDWDDVEIKAQATNYEDARNGVDDGFFTWDATTQTLTSVKSNNNKGVYVRLGLKSKPGVQTTLTVATGEGWNYTMIKPSQEEHTYTGYGYMSFSFDFAPKASEDEKFDYNSLEIDPETNPNGYFSIPMTYAAQGWPLYVNSDTPAGEYTVRFWLKSNHNVSCTVKVIAYPEE